MFCEVLIYEINFLRIFIMQMICGNFEVNGLTNPSVQHFHLMGILFE